MLNLFPIAFALVSMISLSQAQSQSDLIASGDSAVRARDAKGALKAYETAIAKDSANVILLHKTVSVLVSMAEFESDMWQKKTYAEKAEQYARSAFARDSTSAEAHFVMAQALGRSAQVNMLAGLRYGPAIYNHATRCLAVKPDHGGCLHVVGAWHSELRRRGEIAMAMAATVAKNDIYKTANWDSAQVYLERAVRAEPNVIIHRLTLGRIYRDSNKPDLKKARESFEAAIKAPLKVFNDEQYIKQAKEDLQALSK